MSECLKQVTKDEFFSSVGRLDVHPVPTGKHPYTSIFKTPAGFERGRIVGTIPEGQGLPVFTYFIRA